MFCMGVRNRSKLWGPIVPSVVERRNCHFLFSKAFFSFSPQVLLLLVQASLEVPPKLRGTHMPSLGSHTSKISAIFGSAQVLFLKEIREPKSPDQPPNSCSVADYHVSTKQQYPSVCLLSVCDSSELINERFKLGQITSCLNAPRHLLPCSLCTTSGNSWLDIFE